MPPSPAERIREFILRKLVRDEDVELAPEDPIFSSGLLDSFAVSELICFLEDELGVRIPVSKVRVEDFDTITRCLAMTERFAGPPPE